jgi:hypothetical protein
VADKEKEIESPEIKEKFFSKEISDINACVERCVEILISLCFSP